MESELVRVENIAVGGGPGGSILKIVSLSIEAGQHITLVGPNGAGKSTLLKVLIGEIQPSAGKVIRREGLRIGYMPQRLHLNTLMPMTVKRFLDLSAVKQGPDPASLLKDVGMEGYLGQTLHALSGGELQRLMLARTMLRRPDILILDEPAQNLDITGQVEMYRLIRDIQRKWQCAVFLVSHDLHLVMRNTDTVICLYHHICCSGKPDEMMHDDSFSEAFGGKMKDVMAYYTHAHDHQH